MKTWGDRGRKIKTQRTDRNADTQAKGERRRCETQVARERGNLGRRNVELERTRAKKERSGTIYETDRKESEKREV